MPEQPSPSSRSASIRRAPRAFKSHSSVQPPAISVSIVTYETPEAELRPLLRDLARSRSAVGVTVVDNSPSEALRPVVEKAGISYLAAGRNLGFGGGHNLAMQSTLEGSEYHLICNPDVRLGPDVLDALARFMDASPEVGLVMPRVLYPDGREQRLCKRLPTPADLLLRRFLGAWGKRLFGRSADAYELRHVNLNIPREVPSLSGCFMFLRTSVLRQTGLFDPRFFMYMEDVDLCRRVAAVSRTVFYPAVSVTHNYAKGSYKNPRLLRYHLQSALRYFSKWGWFMDPERRALNRRIAVWAPQVHDEPTATVATYAGTR